MTSSTGYEPNALQALDTPLRETGALMSPSATEVRIRTVGQGSTTPQVIMLPGLPQGYSSGQPDAVMVPVDEVTPEKRYLRGEVQQLSEVLVETRVYLIQQAEAYAASQKLGFEEAMEKQFKLDDKQF